MSRSRLHVNSLDQFAQFCESHGWVREEPKGFYQVLRMRHPSCLDPLIVHKRLTNSAGNELVHLTLHGHSETMVSRYLRYKKQNKVVT